MFALPNGQITTSASNSLSAGACPLKGSSLLTFPSPPLPLPPDDALARTTAPRSRLFRYLRESNSYRCPAGQLNFVVLNVRDRTHAYVGSWERCGGCAQKAQCTTAGTSVSPSRSMSPRKNAIETEGVS